MTTSHSGPDRRGPSGAGTKTFGGLIVLLLALYGLFRPAFDNRQPDAPGNAAPPIQSVSDGSGTPDRSAAPAAATTSADEGHSASGSSKSGSSTSAVGLGSHPASRGSASDEFADPPLGQLRDVGNKVLVSTAGLRYVPGSREGHRLDHVLRHDNDSPDRPGKHGVFDGGRDDLLRVLDEAWLLVKARDPAVTTEVDGDRVVHDIDMRRRIGFVGGQDGNARGRPAATHIRMVVEGDNLITAYPY